MKKICIMSSIIIINFIFQTSLYNFAGIFGVVPNISLIFVVIFAMMTNSILGGIFGILTGILFDMMLQDVFGIYTLIFFIIGGVIGSFSEDVNRENYMLYAVSSMLATAFMHFALFIILFFLKYKVENSYYILGNIVLEIILNTILSIIVLKFVEFSFKKLNLK